MAKKRANSAGKEKAGPVAGVEGPDLIDREVFDWGVRLTARPFRGTAKHATMIITSEIRNYRERRGSEVLISFPAASMQSSFRLLDARAWHMALGSIIRETTAVQAEMRKNGKAKNKKS